jgi:2'-5' RNA ligase
MQHKPDTYIRCFIALDISDQIKRDCTDIIDRLKEHDADVKWVRADTMHLTLKFLGRTRENILPKIQECLFNVVLSYNPFYIRIYAMGIFPNRKNPRVIWVGIEESDMLKRLHIDIENTMAPLGFTKEQRPFKPHLTLGRVRSRKGILHVVHDLDTFKDKEFGNIHVKQIKLMKSDLKHQGAIYSCLYEFPLGREGYS